MILLSLAEKQMWCDSIGNVTSVWLQGSSPPMMLWLLRFFLPVAGLKGDTVLPVIWATYTNNLVTPKMDIVTTDCRNLILQSGTNTRFLVNVLNPE